MKKRPIKIAAIGGLFAIMAVSAVACHGSCHGRMSPEKITKFATYMIDDTLDDIEASDTQSKQINAIKERLLGQALAIRKGSCPVTPR